MGHAKLVNKLKIGHFNWTLFFVSKKILQLLCKVNLVYTKNFIEFIDNESSSIEGIVAVMYSMRLWAVISVDLCIPMSQIEVYIRSGLALVQPELPESRDLNIQGRCYRLVVGIGGGRQRRRSKEVVRGVSETDNVHWTNGWIPS